MPKGKYEDIVKNLRREWGTEAKFQEKVDAIKRAILEGDPSKQEDPEKKEMVLSSEALEDLIAEVTALQKVINDALIRKVHTRTAQQLATLYTDIRKMKDAFSEQESTTNVLVEAYEQLLVEQYEVESTRSLEIYDVGVVRVQYEPAAKVIDKAKNNAWAKQNGMENDLCLPWPTLNALTKALLLQGNDAPDGVEAVSRPKVVFTREK